MVQVQAWLNHTGRPYAIYFNYYTLLVAQSRVKLKWQSQLENCRVNYNTLAGVSSGLTFFIWFLLTRKPLTSYSHIRNATIIVMGLFNLAVWNIARVNDTALSLRTSFLFTEL